MGMVLQGLIHRGMSPKDMQQGWDVALTPTHLAVTLPTRVAAVYQLQVGTPTVSLPGITARHSKQRHACRFCLRYSMLCSAGLSCARERHATASSTSACPCNLWHTMPCSAG